MEIIAENLGKRFNRDWIFRNLNFNFQAGKITAVTGPNGSGKSTLLKVLSAQMPFNQGHLSYSIQGKTIASEQVYQHLSIAAPYLELIEEFSLEEMWNFHFGFKGLRKEINQADGISLLGLEKGKGKQIKNFSSGMKQRLKLGLAFFSENQLLLLDEPSSNLDSSGMEMYLNLIRDYHFNRTIIIASNIPKEVEMAHLKLKVG